MVVFISIRQFQLDLHPNDLPAVSLMGFLYAFSEETLFCDKMNHSPEK